MHVLDRQCGKYHLGGNVISFKSCLCKKRRPSLSISNVLLILPATRRVTKWHLWMPGFFPKQKLGNHKSSRVSTQDGIFSLKREFRRHIKHLYKKHLSVTKSLSHSKVWSRYLVAGSLSLSLSLSPSLYSIDV